MSKIRKVRISFERLLKVWLSKLDTDEEELVEKDLIWFNSIFDNFFKGDNLNEYINKEGQYGERKVEDFDLVGILKASAEFSSNKPERLARLKIEEPNLFEHYRNLNNAYFLKERKYNLIDIYFRVFKKLYIQAEFKDLTKIKWSILLSVNSTVHKILIFEKPGFDSKLFLIDFYNLVLRNLFTEKDIKDNRPDEVFLSTSLFKSSFAVYYLPLFKPHKVTVIRRYLLNTWIDLNGLQKDNLLEQFLNSLSDMTLSNSSYREIDLYYIRSLLKPEDRDSDYYKNLDTVKNGANQIISFKDLEDFFQFNLKISQVDSPEYILENTTKYFLKEEEDVAIQQYKFRAMQSLVMEYLSIVLHFKDKDNFLKSFNRLRKNEQWSNHHTFFPKSINDVLVWLIIFSQLKREMNFRIEPSFGYKFVDDIIIFFFKDIAYDERSMKVALNLRGLLFNSSFLNSMTGVSSGLLKKVKDNVLLSENEKVKSNTFWNSLSNMFGSQIQESESLTPIKPKIFEDLISDISSQYKDKSLIYFLSKNLSAFSRSHKATVELKTFVVASELQYRKYLIPDWHSLSYGLSGSVSRYLYEEEIIQFDYKFFEKQVRLQDKELKRESIEGFIEKHKKDCLFVFRNAFPDFWIKSGSIKSHKTDLIQPITFTYNTYDRNSELIIVPKSSMSIRYVHDGRFKNLHFPEYSLMWELVDLGGGSVYSADVEKSVKKFRERFGMPEEDLRKLFWIRMVAKTKIIIRDKNSILRFKLNPYGE